MNTRNTTPDTADATASLLVGVPNGGGLRQAFTGLSLLRVPPLRSVLLTATTLGALLLSVMVLVVGVDAHLGSVLNGQRLRISGIFGVLGLIAASGSLMVLLTTALDGPTQPRTHVERHPLRLAVGLGLLLTASICALLWMQGTAGG